MRISDAFNIGPALMRLAHQKIFNFWDLLQKSTSACWWCLDASNSSPLWYYSSLVYGAGFPKQLSKTRKSRFVAVTASNNYKMGRKRPHSKCFRISKPGDCGAPPPSSDLLARSAILESLFQSACTVSRKVPIPHVWSECEKSLCGGIAQCNQVSTRPVHWSECMKI